MKIKHSYFVYYQKYIETNSLNLLLKKIYIHNDCFILSKC